MTEQNKLTQDQIWEMKDEFREVVNILREKKEYNVRLLAKYGSELEDILNEIEKFEGFVKGLNDVEISK
jgi:hypothetical protein